MFLLLICTLCVSAYLDSPYSFINKPYLFSRSEPVMAVFKQTVTSSKIPVLEEKLEDRKKVDGYILETYREYEIYKDESGNVIKTVPTAKTDTLKYKDYGK